MGLSAVATISNKADLRHIFFTVSPTTLQIYKKVASLFSYTTRDSSNSKDINGERVKFTTLV